VRRGTDGEVVLDIAGHIHHTLSLDHLTITLPASVTVTFAGSRANSRARRGRGRRRKLSRASDAPMTETRNDRKFPTPLTDFAPAGIDPVW
jgi:hypothetical protein